jgi:hypothetical protein
MRRFRIKVVPGDRVTVGVPPHDPVRGIITFRARQLSEVEPNTAGHTVDAAYSAAARRHIIRALHSRKPHAPQQLMRLHMRACSNWWRSRRPRSRSPLGLDPRLLEGVRDLGLSETRPIQSAVITLVPCRRRSHRPRRNRQRQDVRVPCRCPAGCARASLHKTRQNRACSSWRPRELYVH